jgi:hypothetical protein
MRGSDTCDFNIMFDNTMMNTKDYSEDILCDHMNVCKNAGNQTYILLSTCIILCILSEFYISPLNISADNYYKYKYLPYSFFLQSSLLIVAIFLFDECTNPMFEASNKIMNGYAIGLGLSLKSFSVVPAGQGCIIAALCLQILNILYCFIVVSFGNKAKNDNDNNNNSNNGNGNDQGMELLELEQGTGTGTGTGIETLTSTSIR